MISFGGFNFYMKKMIPVLLAAVMFAGLLAGCAEPVDSDSDGGLSIVTTIFPEYDWVKQIMGEQAENAGITMLLDSGIDLHNYQPTAADIMKLSQCDLFIYVGGESDSWVGDTLASAAAKDRVVVNLLDVLGEDIVREEEYVAGMEHDADDEDTPENDEHVWLSLKNAVLICGYISERLAEIDPEHKDIYTANTAAYIEKLTTLDSEYQKAADAASNKTLLFGDRFPFRYLADDYGLEYYAAFSGCSAESEASFETIAFLSQKVDELGLGTVLTIDGVNHKIAETVIETAESEHVDILSLNSMQSITSADIQDGITYLSIMEDNLEVLKNALM